MEVMPACSSEAGPWPLCPLYLSNMDELMRVGIIDVLLELNKAHKSESCQQPSISHSTRRAKEALAQSPYDMRLILELGCAYATDGMREQSLNVFMNGWKRAKEITDVRARFRFLMRTAELSLELGKPSQALAVWCVIKEPVHARDARSYFLLGIRIWAANGSLEQALKLFGRTIYRHDFEYALRILAVVMQDLHKVGAYEVAQTAVSELSGRRGRHPSLELLGRCVEWREGTQAQERDMHACDRWLLVAAVCLGALAIFCFLFALETVNLKAISMERQWKHM